MILNTARRRPPRWPMLLLLAAVLPVGCETNEIPVVPDAADPVERDSPRPVRRSDEPEPAFQLTGPHGEAIEFARLYVRLLALPDGRPAALHLASYADSASERFPSLLLFAVVPQRSLDELPGQAIEAQAFFQASRDGPPWKSPEGQPVRLQILTLGRGTLSGKIVQGQLQNVATGQRIELSGSWQAQM